MRSARFRLTASLLSSGQVLVIGGLRPDGTPLNSTELYTPISETFADTGDMRAPRFDGSSITLLDGRVLIAPFTQLERISKTATVTIGGISAQVLFAGLTPGFSGLYQVNGVVPPGVAAGNQAPVTVSVNGVAGAGNIFMALQ